MVPLGSIGLTAVGGKVHAIGGRGTDLKTVSTHHVPDAATGPWSEAAPLAKARDHTATLTVDGKIHVIGGRFNEPADTTTLHEIYGPATNAWSAAPPAGRSSLATAVYEVMILVIGGETTTGRQTDNEGFDVKEGRWVKLAPLPLARQRRRCDRQHGLCGRRR